MLGMFLACPPHAGFLTLETLLPLWLSSTPAPHTAQYVPTLPSLAGFFLQAGPFFPQHWQTWSLEIFTTWGKRHM